MRNCSVTYLATPSLPPPPPKTGCTGHVEAGFCWVIAPCPFAGITRGCVGRALSACCFAARCPFQLATTINLKSVIDLDFRRLSFLNPQNRNPSTQQLLHISQQICCSQPSLEYQPSRITTKIQLGLSLPCSTSSSFVIAVCDDSPSSPSRTNPALVLSAIMRWNKPNCLS